ncbi:MAG: hypoxanthine phosphoribosyltransferase [Chloroflexota bacterium]
MLANDVKRILISEEELQERVAELGAQISEFYHPDSRPLLVCVLKGAYMFLSDLTKHITIPHEVDFMATSTYDGGLDAQGAVRLMLDLKANIADRHVLLVEDIVDRGATIDYLLRMLKQRQPKSLHVCSLLDKPERRVHQIEITFLGFTIPDEFVIGYGLDIDEMYRNIPFIGIPKQELIDRLISE